MVHSAGCADNWVQGSSSDEWVADKYSNDNIPLSTLPFVFTWILTPLMKPDSSVKIATIRSRRELATTIPSSQCQ